MNHSTAPIAFLTRIISGGQTGADQGGLSAALDLSPDGVILPVAIGGWAPKGWPTEDGQVPDRFRRFMKETPSAGWAQRTEWNIRDSDATMILSMSDLADRRGGSKLTWEVASRTKKPVLWINVHAAPPSDLVADIVTWLSVHRPGVLNIAGPRESKAPGIYEATRSLVANVCRTLEQSPLTKEEASRRLFASTLI